MSENLKIEFYKRCDSSKVIFFYACLPPGIKKGVIYSKKGKIFKKKKKDTIKQPVLLLKCILKMKNDPKLVQILLFFIKKWTFTKDFLNFQGPGKL